MLCQHNLVFAFLQHFLTQINSLRNIRLIATFLLKVGSCGTNPFGDELSGLLDIEPDANSVFFFGEPPVHCPQAFP